MNRPSRFLLLLASGLLFGCNDSTGPVVSNTMPPAAPGDPQTAPPPSKAKPGAKPLVRRTMGGNRQLGGE